jgi:hypothetical protein
MFIQALLQERRALLGQRCAILETLDLEERLEEGQLEGHVSELSCAAKPEQPDTGSQPDRLPGAPRRTSPLLPPESGLPQLLEQRDQLVSGTHATPPSGWPGAPRRSERIADDRPFCA